MSAMNALFNILPVWTALKIMAKNTLLVHVIEDNEVDVVGLRRAFDFAGVDYDLTVSQVSSGGLEKLKNFKDTKSFQRLPIVLVDINLPEESGLDFLRKLRADEDLKETPVFIWSSMDDKGTVRTATALDIEGFVHKSKGPGLYLRVATLIKEFWQLHLHS